MRFKTLLLIVQHLAGNLIRTSCILGIRKLFSYSISATDWNYPSLQLSGMALSTFRGHLTRIVHRFNFTMTSSSAFQHSIETPAQAGVSPTYHRHSTWQFINTFRRHRHLDYESWSALLRPSTRNIVRISAGDPLTYITVLNSVTASFSNACKLSSLPSRRLVHLVSIWTFFIHEASFLFDIFGVFRHILVISLYHHLVVWTSFEYSPLLLCGDDNATTLRCLRRPHA